MELKPGDILKRDRSADDMAIVSIDKKDVFMADMGLHRFRKSIQLKELIKTDKDEIKSILEQYEEDRKAKIQSYDDSVNDDDGDEYDDDE